MKGTQDRVAVLEESGVILFPLSGTTELTIDAAREPTSTGFASVTASTVRRMYLKSSVVVVNSRKSLNIRVSQTPIRLQERRMA